MNNIETLVNQIPTAISYLAYGVVFLSIYNFMTFKEVNIDAKTYIPSCLTISYFIKAVTNVILGSSVNKNSVFFIATGVLISVLSSYLASRIVRSNKLNRFFLKIGIERTTAKTFFWDDAIKPYTWLLMHINGDKVGYLGEVELVEENVSYPKFLLKAYQKIDMEAREPIENYSERPDMRIVIDSKLADIVEVVYSDYKPPTPELINTIKEKITTILKK